MHLRHHGRSLSTVIKPLHSRSIEAAAPCAIKIRATQGRYPDRRRVGKISGKELLILQFIPDLGCATAVAQVQKGGCLIGGLGSEIVAVNFRKSEATWRRGARQMQCGADVRPDFTGTGSK
jgi:hypothetical protein